MREREREREREVYNLSPYRIKGGKQAWQREINLISNLSPSRGTATEARSVFSLNSAYKNWTVPYFSSQISAFFRSCLSLFLSYFLRCLRLYLSSFLRNFLYPLSHSLSVCVCLSLLPFQISDQPAVRLAASQARDKLPHILLNCAEQWQGRHQYVAEEPGNPPDVTIVLLVSNNNNNSRRRRKKKNNHKSVQERHTYIVDREVNMVSLLFGQHPFEPETQHRRSAIICSWLSPDSPKNNNFK
jgi:hypothetical protein